MSDRARLEAYNSVKRIFGGAYSNLVLSDKSLQGLDRAFAENIMLGTVERKITLRHILSSMVQKEPQEDLAILLMTGIYQVMYMDRVPDSAACDETVNIAKEVFGRKSAGFVNAVMRNICRNKCEIAANIESSEGYIKYSADKELYKLFEKYYPEDTERIFQTFFGKPPMFIRVNTLKADAPKLRERIGGEIIGETCIKCDKTGDVLGLLDNGEFYIQGLASQEAVSLLGAKAGETVVDVCACPGGKSLGAAIDMENQGHVYSFDLHENKLSLIEDSAKRLGITVIETAKHDGRKAKAELIGAADKVICDVPCSGTGVMGSKPEIKYKSPEEFKGLYPTQKAIIRAASQYLKVGGEMVYSTCSVNKAENEEIVRDFIYNNSDFKLIYERTCMPYEAECEGFYMAKIVREK